MKHPISEELEDLSPEQEGSTLERNLDRPSTSGTNISGSITAHEEALETHPLLDGSTRRSKSDGKPLREKLTIEEKPAKRRSLSLLVHTGSVHTLKVSPKKRRTPQGNFSMAGIPPPVPTVSTLQKFTCRLPVKNVMAQWFRQTFFYLPHFQQGLLNIAFTCPSIYAY
ncbi:hypothetical protein HOLleu_05983 [Holothuria leucospilota]|uniref:Uncharacterized protein n=1 Tax=Holothuria leucospilota TaxID=206669 RepID=A0A9Q1HIL7_HOLLE|nr:hypothetical protein HOLleu_05983 [Holothuria leucospilota]